MPLGRMISILGIITGLLGLFLFLLVIPARMQAGGSLGGAILFYFSFFTILTNIGVVLVYLSEVRPGASLGWFRRPEVRGMFAALIFFVMAVYHAVLATMWDPQGALKVADIALHTVAPLIFIGWWVFFQPHRRLVFRMLPTMLVPPVLYNLYAMARGTMTGDYPYPFLEANKLGYSVVGGNILVLLVLMIALLCLVIAADRYLPEQGLPEKRQPKRS